VIGWMIAGAVLTLALAIAANVLARAIVCPVCGRRNARHDPT
jgi:hypothetical protein